ncbi:MAG: NAD kinase [Micrococcaceae bacterium]
MARNILILNHPGRAEAQRVALQVIDKLLEVGITPYVLQSETDDLRDKTPPGHLDKVKVFEKSDTADLELIIVLGGDGSILRAAELGMEQEVPVLGVNMGHVGFLAESEKEDLNETIDKVVRKDYTVKDRMVIDVKVYEGQKLIHQDWAVNEAALEKSSEERMIEVVVEVDGEPLVSYGCDGILMSTPTGSTAYAFSAGGPVVWPHVEAMLLVPLSAHTLFSKPLIVGDESTFAVEMIQRNDAKAKLWCDGRRTFPVKAGQRVEVNVSEKRIYLARLKEVAFTSRLVRKFNLPVTGWRGPDEGKQA